MDRCPLHVMLTTCTYHSLVEVHLWKIKNSIYCPKKSEMAVWRLERVSQSKRNLLKTTILTRSVEKLFYANT